MKVLQNKENIQSFSFPQPRRVSLVFVVRLRVLNESGGDYLDEESDRVC